jgi:hypothetical protein
MLNPTVHDGIEMRLPCSFPGGLSLLPRPLSRLSRYAPNLSSGTDV